MEEVDLFVQIATQHPRVAGVLSVVLVVLVLVGLVCAQIDADALDATHPRLATAVRWGARLGALAAQLRKKKVPREK
jgi:hypothetical protein